MVGYLELGLGRDWHKCSGPLGCSQGKITFLTKSKYSAGKFLFAGALLSHILLMGDS